MVIRALLQVIVDMLQAPLKAAFQDVIASVVTTEIQSLAKALLPQVPIVLPLTADTEVCARFSCVGRV